MSRHRAGVPVSRRLLVPGALTLAAGLALGFPGSALAGESPGGLDDLDGLGCALSVDAAAVVSGEAVVAVGDVDVCGSTVALDL